MKKQTIRWILLILCAGIFCFCVFQVARVRLRGNREQGAFDRLTEQAARRDDTTPAGEVLERFHALLAENGDLRGWLTIPDTGIDYPVMQSELDREYYLHRAFDRSDSVSGTPFLDFACTPESDCVIVYAHNMKNGTMFGTLDRYLRQDYRDAHPTIWFDSLTEEREYEVFAAVQTRVYGTGAPGFHYYESAGTLTASERRQLVDWLLERSVWDCGVTPEEDDQILILSTCSYHTQDGRFLIAARRIER